MEGVHENKMSGYPIMLDIKGKPALVVGGGKVAERKIQGLLEAEADVIVVSPALTPELAQQSAENKIRWLKREFKPEDTADAYIVVAASSSRETNQAVKAVCTPHQLVTIADDPEASDFHTAATVKRGMLTISVSTSGASPFLAARLRREIEDSYSQAYEEFTYFLFGCRKKILASSLETNKKSKLLQEIAADRFFQEGNWKAEFDRLYRDLK
ncbi:siroheme synthase [Bacillus sp. M6-12]|uniref:precorrin-2 dehydrogenase/sirohydrochlorin ferrochelatase family protein n=1 Tax=Bacillus sp. M6-12 TaxID=2054166 RepID=UPI000C7781DB|nr:NAD(P)-dependent oxidoreductase [Bacillus sp. M6-12]PLS17149.1 siroheme synthase [Bacillus sp. M6-12]